MARIFTYITHKGGAVDDTAFELAAAARRIDPAASPTAILTGWGGNLDAACRALGASYPEIWKIADRSSCVPQCGIDSESPGQGTAERQHRVSCP